MFVSFYKVERLREFESRSTGWKPVILGHYTIDAVLVPECKATLTSK